MLRGKRILVTGATGGLGPSVVEACLAVGGEVVAAARRRTQLDQLRAEMKQHERLHVAECDTTDPQGVEALFDALTAHSPLHGVVHAVGAFAHGPVSSLEDTDVERLIGGNLTSAALVTRGALRRMQPLEQGRVVLIAADALTPSPGLALYGAAKAGVAHLAQAAAREAEKHGVCVNALLPGILDTPSNRAAMPDSLRAGWIPPTKVAKAVVWLLSDADAVRGALIRLHGS